MATAMETIAVAVEKMGIMESGDDVHTVAATAKENNSFSRRCRRSVNEPLMVFKL